MEQKVRFQNNNNLFLTFNSIFFKFPNKSPNEIIHSAMDSINDTLMDNLEGEILLQGELVIDENLLTSSSLFKVSIYLNYYQTEHFLNYFLNSKP